MSQIKAVYFDWGGVLIDCPGKPLVDYFSKYFQISNEDFLKVCHPHIESYQRNEMDENQLWLSIGNQLNIKINQNKNSLWAKAVREIYSEKKEMITLAKNLKSQGLKLALLSNTEMPVVPIFYEKNYTFFDDAIFSCVEGCRKPEDKIYHIALNRLNVKPQETFFIDDRIENIEKAIQLGFNAHHFKTYEALRLNLNELGIFIS